MSGFIPTGVGNGMGAAIRVFKMAVHPHGRGERKKKVTLIILMFGSSPRAWGTVGSGGVKTFNLRFIPTGVGNGVELTAPFALVRFIPTGVGNGRWKSALLGRNRFIPTGVGNGKGRWPTPNGTTVHPHGRGERS